jgi:hypothetical protein
MKISPAEVARFRVQRAQMLLTVNAADGYGDAEDVRGINTEGGADNLQLPVQVISLASPLRSTLAAEAKTVPALDPPRRSVVQGVPSQVDNEGTTVGAPHGDLVENRREGKRPMELGDPSGAKKAWVEEESNMETQEPTTFWDNRLDIGDFIQETFCYDRDVVKTDEMDDDDLIKATERHSLQLTFLTHQSWRRMVVRNREMEETAKGYERLMSDYLSLQNKNDRRKAALERIRQERDSLKKQLEDVEMACGIEASKRDDLEKKLQRRVQNLEAVKALHNEVVSKLEGKKKDQDKCTTESAQRRGEVASLQLKVVNSYDTGFALAVEHMKIIAPGLDTSRFSPQLEVRYGQLVREPFLKQGNAPV